uniref:Uncharacterized protein n=1 Tax=Oryza sativa subsp. japonica TaxID=39947 RepID=Q69K87_ORYSJ|nr:hypothetical protein [Oryza sativa Japonica Group]
MEAELLLPLPRSPLSLLLFLKRQEESPPFSPPFSLFSPAGVTPPRPVAVLAATDIASYLTKAPSHRFLLPFRSPPPRHCRPSVSPPPFIAKHRESRSVRRTREGDFGRIVFLRFPGPRPERSLPCRRPIVTAPRPAR